MFVVGRCFAVVCWLLCVVLLILVSCFSIRVYCVLCCVSCFFYFVRVHCFMCPVLLSLVFSLLAVSGVRCSLFAVCCLLCGVSRLLFAVWC